MKALLLILLSFIALNYGNDYDVLTNIKFNSADQFISRSVYGSARYETVYNTNYKRVGQLVGNAIALNGLTGSGVYLCASLDPHIPVDNVTYTVYDYGKEDVNRTIKPVGLTVASNTSQICANVTSDGVYYPIIRLSSYANSNGTALANDTCGVLGGDNTTCCNGHYNCSYHGTCNTVTGVCRCDDGYGGSYCQHVLNCTELLPCVNGTYNFTSGICECNDGFTGPACHIPDCGNNGYYVTSEEVCKCIIGFTGDQCDECSLSPQNDTTRTYRCLLTGDEDNPQILVALTNQQIAALRVFTFTPGTTYNDIDYDCACKNTSSITSSSHSSRFKKHRKSKSTSVTSHVDQEQRVTDYIDDLFEEFGADIQDYAHLIGKIITLINTQRDQPNNSFEIVGTVLKWLCTILVGSWMTYILFSASAQSKKMISGKYSKL